MQFRSWVSGTSGLFREYVNSKFVPGELSFDHMVVVVAVSGFIQVGQC